jgi:hypothetical protein
MENRREKQNNMGRKAPDLKPREAFAGFPSGFFVGEFK